MEAGLTLTLTRTLTLTLTLTLNPNPSPNPNPNPNPNQVAARYGAEHAAPVPPGAPRQGVGCDEEDEVLLVECGAVSAPGATPSRQPRPPAPSTALTPHS